VATTTAVALPSGGDGSGRSIGEVESSKGGLVLHLQALGGGVGCGAIEELMEEGAAEGEGGVRHRCHGFNSRGCRFPSPSTTSSSPMLVTMMTMTMTTTTTRA
jgi:hypothetical protein